jgi:hypothetical protein
LVNIKAGEEKCGSFYKEGAQFISAVRTNQIDNHREGDEYIRCISNSPFCHNQGRGKLWAIEDNHFQTTVARPNIELTRMAIREEKQTARTAKIASALLNRRYNHLEGLLSEPVIAKRIIFFRL